MITLQQSLHIVDIRGLLIQLQQIHVGIPTLPNSIISWLIDQVVTSYDPHCELLDTFQTVLGQYIVFQEPATEPHLLACEIIDTILEFVSCRVLPINYVTSIQEIRSGLWCLHTERFLTQPTL